MTHLFDWPYLTLRADGVLVYDEDHAKALPFAIDTQGEPIRFADVSAAEAWLTHNDIRGTIRTVEPPAPKVCTLKHALLAEQEIRDVRQLICILRDEIHHPGAARHTNPRYEIDRHADDLLYMIDHALENLRE